MHVLKKNTIVYIGFDTLWFWAITGGLGTYPRPIGENYYTANLFED